MSQNKIAAEIAVSTGYALTVENFSDEIGPAFVAAKRLSAEINRPASSAEEPTLVYVIAHDGTVTA